jgi:phosphatidylserine/phosphatidylglycerophosphate/cardiolipin synthase-like enzyme
MDYKVVFDKNIEKEIIYQIRQTKKRIFIMHFWFTYKPIIDELINLKSKGVEVKILTDHRTYTNKLENKEKIYDISALKYMWENNIEAFVYKGVMMHNKVIMIDDYLTITGSANLYKESLFKHNENLIIIENKDINLIYMNKFNNLCTSTMKLVEIKIAEKKKNMQSIKIQLKQNLRKVLFLAVKGRK